LNKTLKIYIVVFVLVIIAMFYYQESKPKPINWFPSYTQKHKIPYGTFVLYKELQQLFPKTTIEDIAIPPYVFLKDNEQKGTYFFVDASVGFDEDEFNQLLEFVANGNEVFISTSGINIDTLGLKTKQIIPNSINETAYFKLYNTSFKNKEYGFNRKFSNYIFTDIDTTTTVILGQSGFVNKDGERTKSGVNFIRHPFGKGNFYFHTFPEAFTNYQILTKGNEIYTAGLLSYLKNPSTLFWDSYHKTGKSKISSPMHYILSSNSLKWAYYFILFGVLFFVIFEGKRKQRSVPIITPLKNQSLAFSRTIANMYLEKKEHKIIAEHKIQYLLEFIRTKLRISTVKIDESFYKTVAARSGKSEESIQKLFTYIDYIHQKNALTQTGLEQLNQLIEKFKTES